MTTYSNTQLVYSATAGDVETGQLVRITVENANTLYSPLTEAVLDSAAQAFFAVIDGESEVVSSRKDTVASGYDSSWSAV